MRTRMVWRLCWLVLALVPTLLTQGVGQPEERRWRLLFQKFEEEAPKVGQALPEVTAFNEKGQPFRLERLKGRYTVLVFGCLT